MNDTQLLTLQEKSTQTFAAKVLTDSVNTAGDRLTTFELTYPRMIHCFLDDTEFLSQVCNEFPEFRNYDAVVALGAKVAQYSADGTIEFVLPVGAVSKAVDSIVECKNKLFPLAVSSGHRMYSLKRSTGNVFSPCVDTVEDWQSGPVGSRRIPKAGSLANPHRTSSVSPEEAALIAFYVADGHVVGNRVVFHFVKRRKVTSVVSFLTALGIDYDFTDYGRDCCIRFDAPQWVEQCYTESGTKKYPDFVWSMSSESYSAFFEATLDSDGCRANIEISTTSTDCADQLQVLSLLNEKAMNVRVYSRGLYKQTYLDQPYLSYRKDKNTLVVVEGQHRVVCFQVPSSFLVVRRQGVAFVSGNCEIMTHRLFSRNAASSRAIPVERIITAVKDNPFVPFHWGANQTGMQADEVLTDADAANCRWRWLTARDRCLEQAAGMRDAGLHKQIANRILEPWMFITVVLSTTSFRHFEILRNHSAAEPHFQHLARLMVAARSPSVPQLLQPGEWHLPLIHPEDREVLNLEQLKRISVARCAAVSYVRQNERKDYEKDFALYDRLVGGTVKHSSPLEHVATPFATSDDCYLHSGSNFDGWKQHRKEIEGEYVPDEKYVFE